MLFNTKTFAVFFLLIFTLYVLMRKSPRKQNLLLLVGSYVFYGWWDVRFLFLIVLSTAVDYTVGLLIDRGKMTGGQRMRVSIFLLVSAFLFLVPDYSHLQVVGLRPAVDWGALLAGTELGWSCLAGVVGLTLLVNLIALRPPSLSEKGRRKLLLFISVAVNLGILGFFKYFNFFADGLADLSEMLFGSRPSSWTLEIVLPVGISFYTFQTMSYTIDVYRKEVAASEHFLEFATYVAFFPQLVAGPIERGKHLLPQFFQARPPLSREAFRSAAWLIGWGLYKKVVVADNMAMIANPIFRPFDEMETLLEVPDDGLRLAVGVLAFAFQIYGDFSGYTDMARGLARLLGFDIMLNFNLPYFATSPSDFWRRWHISLSSWLRDYLYIPLGGNRKKGWPTYKNLTLTMLLGGLWHGAAWTFIVWGAYHGLLLTVYRALGLRTEAKGLGFGRKLAFGLLMFFFTCGGWLIFRAQNLGTIQIFVEGIFLHPSGSPETWAALSQLAFFAWFLVLFQVIQASTGDLDPMRRWHWFVRLNVWIFIIMSIQVFVPAQAQEFIYFAF